MDGYVEEQSFAYNGDEQTEQQHFYSEEHGVESIHNVDGSSGNEIRHSIGDEHLGSSSGKLFVGGIAWETTEELFNSYFSKYGEIIDSVIMMDKVSGRSRGFGFVTFADPAVADKVLEEDHFIDGRAVEVKRTVPREDKQVRGVSKTKKIFVGGIPLSLTEDELGQYFSSYGKIVEHQIMLDHQTGRPRGFGFVTFENEDAVEKIFSDGQMHELGGKQVEIKRAEPKRAGGDLANDSWQRHGVGSSKSYGGFGRGAVGYRGGNSRKMGRGYGGYGEYGSYGGYDSYGGNYGGDSPGFYAGYGGGYGFGFGGPMYSGAGYGGSGYATHDGYGDAAGYAGGKGYGGGGGYGSGHGSGGRGYGGGRGYSSGGGRGGYGNGGAATGRHHPYRK